MIEYEAFLLRCRVKAFRTFIVILISVITLVAMVYLINIAMDMEEYTFSRDNSTECCIIMYSSKDKFAAETGAGDIARYGASLIEKLGWRAIIVDENSPEVTDIRKEIVSCMKDNAGCALLRIAPTNLVVNSTTCILKVGCKDNSRYPDNLELAKEISGQLKKSRIKAMVTPDNKNNYLQNMTKESVMLEMSKKADIRDLKTMMDKTVNQIIK